MILEWLVQDFKDLFARDSRARVALWCDAKAEFRNILPNVADRFAREDIALLAFDKARHRAALWLKWAAEVGPGAGKKVVIWLPYAREHLKGKAPDGTRLDPLLEYEYAGLVWLIEGKPPTLFSFLKKHGVPLPTNRSEQARLWKGGPDSPLAKYVSVHLDRDEAFWKSRMLSLAVIEESIVGNLEERLLQFLVDPKLEWEALQEAGIAEEFCSQVDARYANTDDLATEPQTWAEKFVKSLALVEVFEATGEPEDFPFQLELPPEERRPHLREFLRRWMRDRDHLETYKRWALKLEGQIDLRAWARTKEGRPQALRSLAADRWARFLQGLRDQGKSETNLQRYLRENREIAAEEAKGFWAAGTGDLPGWKLAIDLADLIERVNRTIEEAKQIKTA